MDDKVISPANPQENTPSLNPSPEASILVELTEEELASLQASLEDNRVVSINKPRGKGRPKAVETPKEEKVKAPKEKKWPAVQIQNDIIKMIERLSGEKKLEIAFPKIFANYRTMRLKDTDKEAIFRILDNKQIELVTMHAFELIMSGFYRMLFDEDYGGNAMEASMQHRTTAMIIQFLPVLKPEEIKIFSYPGEDIYCWKKLDFELIDLDKMKEGYDSELLDDDSPRSRLDWAMDTLSIVSPCWHEIMTRSGNTEALMAWFGSLFDREVRNTQFIYMQGDGGDSKGTIIQTVQRVFGPKLYHAQNIPEKNSGAERFFNAALEGKLLLFCPDTSSENLFSDKLKSLTSSDDLLVEPKGKDSRNAKNHVHVFIASNERPKIPDKDYAKRRIILVPMTKITEAHEAGYEDKLYKERHLFFSYCYFLYKSMPSPMQITQDMSVYKANDAELNQHIIEHIDAYLSFPPMLVERTEADGSVKKIPWKDQPHTEFGEFERYLKANFKGFTMSQVRNVLFSQYGISKQSKLISLTARSKRRAIMGVVPKYQNAGSPGLRRQFEGDAPGSLEEESNG